MENKSVAEPEEASTELGNLSRRDDLLALIEEQLASLQRARDENRSLRQALEAHISSSG